MEDKQGRLWAISNSGGLFLYNKEEDRFEYQNRKIHLPDDQTFSIEGDAFGNIWVALNKSLAYITWKSQDAEDLRNITYFTREDGLGEVHFRRMPVISLARKSSSAEEQASSPSLHLLLWE